MILGIFNNDSENAIISHEDFDSHEKADDRWKVM